VLFGLSPSHTTVAIQNMYAYQKALQILMSTFRTFVLRDVAPVGRFEVFRPADRRNINAA